MWGTGNDLNTGSFVTLNGEKVKDSIADFRKAFSEANLLGGTKKERYFLGWQVTLTKIMILQKI